MASAVVLFLRSASWDARHLAVNLALTAAALGDEVHLALFAEPLRLYVEGRFDEGAPPEARAARVTELSAALAEGRRDLGVRIVACDTALRLVGLDPARATPPLDGVASLPSLWRLAQGGRALTI
jgi:predicted peroxiredoxin